MSCRPTLCPSIGVQSLFWHRIASLGRIDRVLTHRCTRRRGAMHVSASSFHSHPNNSPMRAAFLPLHWPPTEHKVEIDGLTREMESFN
mmetsp:Transcript_2445/g.8752  ORF Transcript_2445/g.8752 Transcript_2445/m.8752 type:complete len:88 (-) Transcript_2445:675-938(-)